MSHEFVDRMMEQNKTGELRSPVSETLDMHLTRFGRGEAVYEMPAREELGNPLGVIQGGVATALADAAMAAATTTILTDDEIQKSASLRTAVSLAGTVASSEARNAGTFPSHALKAK